MRHVDCAKHTSQTEGVSHHRMLTFLFLLKATHYRSYAARELDSTQYQDTPTFSPFQAQKNTPFMRT